MGKPSVKCKKTCVDRPRDIIKLTCPIHGPEHSPEQCKVLNKFGKKYDTDGTFKEERQNLEAAKSARRIIW